MKRVGGTLERTEDRSLLDQEVDQFQRVSSGLGALQEGFRGIFGALEAEKVDTNAPIGKNTQDHDAKDEETPEEEMSDEDMIKLLRELLDGLESSLGGTLEEMHEGMALSDGLSDKRDEFIAGRIADSLQEGETGYLFLGDAHNVARFLPPDIQTEILDDRLTEIRIELDTEKDTYFSENSRDILLGTEGNNRLL